MSRRAGPPTLEDDGRVEPPVSQLAGGLNIAQSRRGGAARTARIARQMEAVSSALLEEPPLLPARPQTNRYSLPAQSITRPAGQQQ